ncbi:hypothetical protein HMPREF0670_00875 [Prevotella sp. oral taxon 317 str. F0108]|nr:hypothetical protein HMPREF0670_00875 [Prevotella sp. oral taxon 317 str. F0108]
MEKDTLTCTLVTSPFVNFPTGQLNNISLTCQQDNISFTR